MKRKENPILKEATAEQLQTIRKLKLEDIRLIKKFKMEDIQEIMELNIDNSERTKYEDQCPSTHLDKYKDQIALDQQITLENLPDLVMEKIFGFLSFHEIAKARIVCHTFNNVCQRLLNQGLCSAKRSHEKCQKKVDEKFPDEENKHTPNYRFVHVLTTLVYMIDVSFLFLDLTYHLPMKSNRCCFIPGKVLDKIFHSLFVTSNLCKMRSEEATKDEIILKLISDRNAIKSITLMAINHFINEILPIYKNSWTLPVVLVTPEIIPLETMFVEAFTGRLSTNSLDFITYCLYTTYADPENQILNSYRENFQTARIKDETQPNGLDLGLEPEKILWKLYMPREENLEPLLLIKWKDTNEAEFINMKIAYTKFPEFMLTNMPSSIKVLVKEDPYFN